MAHKHSIYDSDPHFSINPSTRAIENESGKINITQYDHNSERFTFEIPRLVDGHDMSKCDLVEIHYDNTDGKNVSSDVYEAPDVQLSPNNPDVVIFSWLISGNATLYKGQLNFSISFQCTAADGTVEYEWGTAPYEGIKVGPRIRNTEAAMQGTTDILAKWKTDLFGIGDTEEASMRAVSQQEQDNIVAKGAEVLATIPADYTATSERAEEAVRTKAEGIILSAEGETIAVNDSANDYVRGLKLFGKSTQVTTTGKNLFNYAESYFPKTMVGVTFTYDDGWVILNGTCTDSTNLKTGIVELSDGTYTISANNPTNNELSLALVQVYNYDSAKGLAATDNKNNSYSVGVISAGTYECRIRIEAGVTYTNFKIKPQLEVGSVATVHEPYTGGKASPSPDWPQEIESIENPTTMIHGKNLLSNDYASDYMTHNGVTYSDAGNGKLAVNGTATANTSFAFASFAAGKRTFISAGTYTVSGNPSNDIYFGFYLYDSQETEEYSLAVSRIKGGVPWTFTIEKDSYYGTYVHVPSGNTVSTVISPQLELGSEATEYEPPHAVQAINLETYALPGIPVESGGNYTDVNGQQWICDEIDFERGVYVQRVAKVGFDGSENWGLYDFQSTYSGFSLHNALDEEHSRSPGISNQFYNFEQSVNDGIWVGVGNMSIYVISKEWHVKGLEAWKTHLSANPLVVYYPRNTPIETPLSEVELAAFRALKTNKLVTTVFNDAGAHMCLDYVADTKTYVDTPKVLKMVDPDTGLVYELKIVDGNLTVVPI